MFLPKAIVLSVLFASAGVAGESHSFSNYEIGESLPKAKLPTLTGKAAPLVRPDKKVSVFFFIRPGQENSATILDEIAKCETEFADRSIYWVGVVSDYYPKADTTAMVKKSGVKAPILVDKGDALYGKLGVRLHPVLGIANDKNVLLAYEPFRRINYCVVVKARILYALGEIDDKQLELALNPPKATQGGDEAVARRNIKFAKMMMKAKKLDKALGLAEKAVQTAPEYAAGHALVGAIKAEQGKCKAAKVHLEKALELDAADETAKTALEKCGGAPAKPTEGAKAEPDKAEPEPEKAAEPEAKAKKKAKKKRKKTAPKKKSAETPAP